MTIDPAPTVPNSRPLLVVDGDNLAHRAYHSTPKSVRGKDDRPINAIVGWTNMLLGLYDAEQPRAVFVGWDTLKMATYRHKLLPTYQAGRVFDREIVEQLDMLPELTRAFGFGCGKAAGYEADDAMASAVKLEVERGGCCLVFTNDRDAYQQVSDRVTVISPVKGIRDIARIGPAEVEARFGVPPSLVRDFKALAGDASDNIPGAMGVGPKKAAALLKAHGSLEAVINATSGATSLRADAEKLLLYREIVTLQTDLDVVMPEDGPPDYLSAAKLLREWGADNLAARLETRAAQPPLPA
jgi:DNA polymerase-1